MSTLSVLQKMAGRPLIRRAADLVLTRRARQRVAWLDRCPLARVQTTTLLRLVQHARHTRFGRLHDFARIRTIADYQARVPLRSYEDFWRDYWQPAFPSLKGETWPEHLPYLALSSGTTSGTTKYLPISRQMLASNRRAGLTTLAFYQAYDPALTLFRGRLFFLGGSTELQECHPAPPRRSQRPVLAGDLSGIVTRELASVLRPYTFPPLDLALLRDWDEKLDRLARESLTQPITMLSGVPSWMLILFERLRQLTGQEHLSAIWPGLQLIIHGGTRFDPYRDLFTRLLGSDRIHLAETYPASEGFIATEDPRYRLLRLIPDHQIFYEFVPVAELDHPAPTRHTIGEIEVGVQYAVVLTTCAGLWSYVLGDTICFEERHPPLLRFTGRTRYYLSAFGEHLISEEIEKAMAAAARATAATVLDFHVGPVFPGTPTAPGHHCYLVEFTDPPRDLSDFARELDVQLCRLNEDYEAHRRGNLTMGPPEIVPVRTGGFASWMRSRGKLGGQHKVPRMDSSGALTAEIQRWMSAHEWLG